MEKIGNMQITDNKENKLLLFSYDFYDLYRVWVLKRRKLKNSLRFSFMSLVTRWFAVFYQLFIELLSFKL